MEVEAGDGIGHGVTGGGRTGAFGEVGVADVAGGPVEAVDVAVAGPVDDDVLARGGVVGAGVAGRPGTPVTLPVSEPS